MLKSAMLDKLKKQILDSAAGNNSAEDNFTTAEKFLFYRYMSAVSNRVIKLDMPLSPELSKYLSGRLNALFVKSGVDDDFKNLIKHIKNVSIKLKLDHMPQDERGWTKVINSIEDTLSESKIPSSLREQILFAAVSLCIIEAEAIEVAAQTSYSYYNDPKMLECSTRVLKTLNSLVGNEKIYASLLDFLDIKDAAKFKKVPLFDFMKLQKKYVDLSLSYMQKLKDISSEMPVTLGIGKDYFYESYAKDSEIVASLISDVLSYDSISSQDRIYGNTLLTWACFFEEGDPELARAVINAGIDVNLASGNTSPAIHAMRLDSPEILQLILDSGRLNITPEIVSTLSKKSETSTLYADVLKQYFPDVEAANNLKPLISGFSFSG